ncbi:hypothetical protein FQU23_003520 [Flavobacterium sp. XN-5]|uniref:hypothetical protein n=1 Tax=Flavobacterium sp. XN-5 TaxID=2599390 RepID=UPI0013EF040C|nr:hypothetical protein [Flavobacterium sp. XN-5]NGY36578.1 hypothetical protein [Flavobacterium sp. XN-5]
MGKKKKNKESKKDKNKLLENGEFAKGLKSECCEKYLKNEDKRCKRCPRFDLPKE